MLKGKALNIRAGHSVAAQEALAKAVKLDPKLAEAWVHLGECYWKNQDVQSAKDCFEGALNHVSIIHTHTGMIKNMMTMTITNNDTTSTLITTANDI